MIRIAGRSASVVAHRGASGYRPEHTIEAFRLGVELGADAIEVDLVMSADRHLIVRHGNDLAHSTDVAARVEFATRQVTKVVDGRVLTGWFIEDFTLEELRTLRATQSEPHVRGTTHDGLFGIVTLEEVLDLQVDLSAELARPVGLKVEAKSASYLAAIGLGLEEALLGVLDGHDRAQHVEVMSFEWTHLIGMRRLGWTGDLVFLVDEVAGPPDLVNSGDTRMYADFLTPAGLAEVATVATAVGPSKTLLFPGGPNKTLGEPSRLFADVKASGLRLDSWTFRSENAFLPTDLRIGSDPSTYGDLAAEVAAYVEAGLDTVITDHPDLVGAAH